MKFASALMLMLLLLCASCRSFDWLGGEKDASVAQAREDPEPKITARSVINARIRTLEQQNETYRNMATEYKVQNEELNTRVKDLEAKVAYYEQYLDDIRENRSGRNVFFDSPESGGTLHRLAPGAVGDDWE